MKLYRFIVLLAVISLPGCHDCELTAETEEVRVISASGEEVLLSSILHEGLTVFIFTDTTCPIANRFSPTIASLIDHFPSATFLMVYPSPSTDLPLIENHLEEFAIPCNFLKDPHHHLVQWTGATRTPEAAVYQTDRNGHSTQIYLGRINNRFADFGVERQQVTEHDLVNALESTLSGKPVPVSKTQAIGCKIPPLP